MALPNMAMIPSGYKPTKLYSVLPTESYGSELVTNGDFATDSNWNKGTGWTISGGSANCDGTQTSQTNFFQVGIVPINVNYKVTFTTTVSAGGVILAIGGSNAQPIVTSSGTYTFIDKATSGDPNLYLSGNADFIGSIDNVSAKEVLVGNADFDVTRATPATRVNQQGLIETPEFIESGDLITNGDFSNGSTDWNLSGTTVVSNGVASFVDNGTNPNSGISQNALVVGKQYKVTFNVSRYVSGQIQVTSSTANDVDISSGVGTYTTYIKSASVTLRFKRNGGFPNYNFDIDNISVVEVERENIPRLDYTDGTCPVLLTELQSTNLITYSEKFSDSNWNKQAGITPTYNTTETLSPDGTYNATKFVGNGTTGVFKSGVSVSGNISRSVYLKSVSGTTTAIFKDPNAEGGATPVNLTITNEWQRFELIGNNGTSAQGLWIDDITSDGLYMWGAQVEQLSYSTSYIPTNGTAVTRNKDIVDNAGTSATYNSVEGVLFVDVAVLVNQVVNKRITISDGTDANRILINISADQISGFVNVNSATQYTFFEGSQSVLNLNKIAIKYKQNDFAVWINGVQYDVSTSGTTFPSNTLTTLSFDNGSTAEFFFGKTSQVQVFNTALSDFDLLNLTSNATAYASYETMRTSLNFNIQ